MLTNHSTPTPKHHKRPYLQNRSKHCEHLSRHHHIVKMTHKMFNKMFFVMFVPKTRKQVFCAKCTLPLRYMVIQSNLF